MDVMSCNHVQPMPTLTMDAMLAVVVVPQELCPIRAEQSKRT